jgi:hypothetical protein
MPPSALSAHDTHSVSTRSVGPLTHHENISRDGRNDSATLLASASAMVSACAGATTACVGWNSRR